MLYLNPDNSNLLVVTLYEKSNNLVNPYFTWKLTNKTTYEETIFYQDDSSTVPYYFNSFTVSVSSAESLTAGVIDVNYGEYEYEIYEKSSPYQLTISTNDNLVESGLLIVLTNSQEIAGYTGSDTDTIKAYTNL